MDYLSTQPENLDGAKTHITELYMKNTHSLSKSSLALRAALEDAESSAALSTTKLTPANEGVGGALAGFGASLLGHVAGAFGGFFATGISNAVLRNKIERTESEIRALTEASAKLISKMAAGKGEHEEKAYRDKIKDASALQIVLSYMAGAFPFVSLYAMSSNGSELQDKLEKLKQKTKEYENLVNEAKKQGKVAIESEAVAAPGTEPAPAETPAAAPVEGEAAPAESEAASAEAPAPAEATAEGETAAAPTADASAAAAPVPAEQATAGTDADAAADEAGQQTVAVSEEVEADRVEGEEIGAELAKAQDQQAATESLADEIGMLAKVSVGLENLAFSMEATKDFGGPAMQTSVMYRTALEALCDVIEVRVPMTPALEEDANPSAKIDSADKAAKSNKGLVQRILDTIRAGLARMGEWIKSAWKFVTSARTRALERAKKLQEQLASATFKTDKIEGNTAKAVRNTGEFITGLAKFSELTAHFSQPATYAPYVTLMENAAFAVGKNTVVDENVVNKALEELSTVFAKGMNEGKAEEGTKVYEAGVTGGMVLKVVVPTTADKIGKFTTTVAVPEGVQLPDVTSVDAANKSQAEQLLKSIIATLEVLEKTSDENGLKGVDDKLDAAAAKARNGGGGSVNDDQDGRIAKAMQKIAGIFSSRAKLPVYAVARAYTSAANNALNLVAASIGQATEAKPAENKPAEGQAAAA